MTHGVQTALFKETAASQNQVMSVALLHCVSEFHRNEHGHGFLELALVIAFVVLGSTPLCLGAGPDAHFMLQHPGREVVHVHNR
jgi:hypothetical protein